MVRRSRKGLVDLKKAPAATSLPSFCSTNNLTCIFTLTRLIPNLKMEVKYTSKRQYRCLCLHSANTQEQTKY
jgi:hypothetical protein